MKTVSRGEFTVFIGAVSGVGKTIAMLRAAQELEHEGTDVVIGCLSFEGLPRAITEMTLLENFCERSSLQTDGLDIDEIVRQKPDLVVVDDLAYTNGEGATRAKRYQEVESLLAAGIDVYTTLNIYEIESYSDIITKVTGARLTQTVPDKFLERVNKIQLVDLPPEAIIERFHAGKVRIHGLSVDELEKFYRRGNLIALREMALRYTAHRVDRQLEDYMQSKDISGPWPVAEKVMVCVSASPFSTELIRFTRQLAVKLKVDWMAVYVETPRQRARNNRELVHLDDNLRMVEELGGEIVVLTGNRVADEIIHLARKRNVREIVMGKPRQSRIAEWFRGSVVDEVIRNSLGISIHVIPGKQEQGVSQRITSKVMRTQGTVNWSSYILVTLFVAALTILLHPLRSPYNLVNIALIYLLPVLISAARWGIGPSFYAAGAGLIVFDWFFVPPFYTFAVSDVRYLLSFAVFLTVATLTAGLAFRLRQQLNTVKHRESVTSTLYALSREITAIGDLQMMLDTVVRQISETVDTDVGIFLPDAEGELTLAAHSNEQATWGRTPSETTVAKWVYRTGETAGRGTDTLRESPDLYLPLRTEEHTYGVLAANVGRLETLDADRVRLVEALSRLAAIAIARVQLAEEAKIAHLTAESERLRNSILDSLSHELRTPLATIIGSVTALTETGEVFSATDRAELLATIREGALRMNRLVTNLLGMVRLESGMLKLRKRLCSIGEIVDAAVRQLREGLQDRQIRVDIDTDIERIAVDDALLEQVMVNLLSNAIKYSPKKSQITVTVRRFKTRLSIAVADEGIGIPKEDITRIFDKFHRSERAMNIPGTGLGLAICKGIVEAHGGSISAESNGDKGTTFVILLPLTTSEKQPTEPILGEEVGVEYV
ncbi:ATP-binding protein [Alicyclobacillus fodiniaquatilis]|uniref:histidine kinase n=1 Tax=Alicyclobacillus fodiniaquatilis TaxID=1661150 RepID=A0ABW4JEF7_9BACL